MRGALGEVGVKGKELPWRQNSLSGNTADSSRYELGTPRRLVKPKGLQKTPQLSPQCKWAVFKETATKPAYEQ